mmetsp:Transcript_31271/g.38068  ORF Transcript_31271/g.38068 Transcript_31271/m.38068 type:complete len:108 (+) Transcript_31271:266-589(+)|eukprot:CAMPEP_0194361876 /NCGR_PEP_ID=MMETSP0174-20130528/9516_1 /TAXON_ID=216777 /ORGANISM="Proboscia alata, Strain PI-D3" /LENGTH=107 /DNA_ID=CAMNT_0039134353 /DNA_START=190 /DNA_END=513 /DNA_ORIENTATION=-
MAARNATQQSNPYPKPLNGYYGRPLQLPNTNVNLTPTLIPRPQSKAQLQAASQANFPLFEYDDDDDDDDDFEPVVEKACNKMRLPSLTNFLSYGKKRKKNSKLRPGY